MAVSLAVILLTVETLAPAHSEYTEQEMFNYHVKETAKVSTDMKLNLKLTSETGINAEAQLSLLTAKSKVEEWSRLGRKPVLTENAAQEMVLEILEPTVEGNNPVDFCDSMAGVLAPEEEISDVVLPEIDVPMGDVIVPGNGDTKESAGELPGEIMTPDIGGTENVNGSTDGEIIFGEDTTVGGDITAGEDTNAGGDIIGGKDTNAGGDIIGGKDTNAGGDIIGGEDISAGEELTNEGDMSAGNDSVVEEVPETPAALSGFLVDGEGMICGVDEISLVSFDGYLELPSEGCVGIRSGALAEMRAGITEVYIPANISVIEEGAFSGMYSLEWIEAEPGNPEYMSIDGVLFDGSGTTLLTFPCGRTDVYVVPAGVMRIASGAFVDTTISRLDFWMCGVIELGENLFGVHGGNGIEVIVSEENRALYQEMLAGYHVQIL